MSEKVEHLISGPFTVERPGYDGEAYAWYVGPHRLEVRFTDTAREVAPDGLSDRAAKALETLGQSEVIEFLGWHSLPDWVEFSTDNLPWIEGGEPSDPDRIPGRDRGGA